MVANEVTGGSRGHSVGPVVRALIRIFNPLAALIAGSRLVPFYALLRHRGRKSGRWYATPVVARPIDGGFVFPLAFGAGTDWARNIRVWGECVVRWRGADHRMVDPRIVGAVEAVAAFSSFERVALRALRIQRFLRVSRPASNATRDG